MKRKRIVLFGAGPACLMAAIQLSEKHEVHLYEKGKTIGRKFLVAGNGGFNLTNQATGSALINAYSNHPILHDALQKFDSNNTREWLSNLGIETFVGSSGRVFPIKGVKPVQVLERIKNKLTTSGVIIHLNHEFVGFNEAIQPLVSLNDETREIAADHYIFGLGGGSWSKTGSNDKWMAHFNAVGIDTKPFKSSNCGLCIDWEKEFRECHEGTPLKNMAVTVGDKTSKGEALITEYGLEGNSIYPIVPQIRTALEAGKKPFLYINFKPNSSVEQLVAKIERKSIKPKNYGYVFSIEKAVVQMVKSTLNKADYLNPITFAKRLQDVPIQIMDLRPVEEAISTVGGIPMSAVNADFSLRKYQHISVIGEMLDWDAPTGGFLLQGCFSTGFVVGVKLG